MGLHLAKLLSQGKCRRVSARKISIHEKYFCDDSRFDLTCGVHERSDLSLYFQDAQ